MQHIISSSWDLFTSGQSAEKIKIGKLWDPAWQTLNHSMSEALRVFVTERLAVAADEILGLVEKTIADYQDEIIRSKREILQLRRELHERRPRSAAADGPEVSEEMFPPQQEWNPNTELQQSRHQLFRQIKEEEIATDGPEVSEEMFPPQQEWNPDTEPQHSRHQLFRLIKEEEMEPTATLEAAPSNCVKQLYSETEGTANYQGSSSDCSAACVIKEEDEEEEDDEEEEEEWTSSQAAAVSPEYLSSRGTASGSICNVCGDIFETTESLSDHLQSHPEVKFCHICCACFKKDIDLIRHMGESHPGEKPFKCNVCDRTFLRRDNLVVHLRTHTGEKPHRCPFCDKSFAQSAYLCVHKRIHTGEKPYCCSVCRKCFSSSNAAKKCLRYHRANSK